MTALARSWAEDSSTRLREEIVAAARELLQRDLVIGSTGNVSGRWDGGFLITPTRAPYPAMGPADLVGVDLDGTLRIAGAAPSREWRLHAAVYRSRPDVEAIVHTHSVHATAWSFLGEPLEPVLEDCEYYEVGEVRTAPRARGGSAELAAGGAVTLAFSGAALLGGHGVVAVGRTPEEAVLRAAVVERQAQLAWLLRRGAKRGSAG